MGKWEETRSLAADGLRGSAIDGIPLREGRASRRFRAVPARTCLRRLWCWNL